MNNNLPASILSSIVQAASKRPLIGEVAVIKARRAHVGPVVALYDCSSSMQELARGGKRKYELVEDARAILHASYEIEFGGFGARATTGHLSLPTGNTPLHLALNSARAFQPSRTIVITDGHPDDPYAALAEARTLSGVIDVVYCGPERDMEAQEFLRKLATVTGGRYQATPWRAQQERALITAVRMIADAESA